jgi:translation elongation factor EF-G
MASFASLDSSHLQVKEDGSMMKPVATMQVEITVPPEFEADVVRDLERRGGSVTRTVSVRVIKGTVLSNGLEDYGVELRSMTAGRGTFRAYPLAR